MALPVPADFKQPTGELSPSWFTIPEELAPTYATQDAYLTALLEAWIADATARVDGTLGDALATVLQGPAVTAFVYHRAYSHAYRQYLAAGPASLRLGDLAKTTSTEQIKGWKQLADEYLAQYEALAAPVILGQVTGSYLKPTRGEADCAEYSPGRVPYCEPGYHPDYPTD